MVDQILQQTGCLAGAGRAVLAEWWCVWILCLLVGLVHTVLLVLLIVVSSLSIIAFSSGFRKVECVIPREMLMALWLITQRAFNLILSTCRLMFITD